jgi:hypothetical protein
MIRKPVKTIEQIEADQEKPVEDKRKADKELVIDMEDIGLYRIIYQPAGGEVPDELKGRFTQMRFAQAAIDNYKATQLAK